MKLREIETILIQSGIEPNEAKIESKMLVKHFCEISDIQLAMNDEFEPRESLLESAKLRAEKRIPIQHIIGTAYFMGEDFIVNENVLIPRDETEILVKKAVEIINMKRGKRKEEREVSPCETSNHSTIQPFNHSTLDIGTGSCCIACMIAKLTETKVLSIDISSKALKVAEENVSKLNLKDAVTLKQSDLFSNVTEKFDLIVSNPPYIPPEEEKNLQTEVKFEPYSALFTADAEGIEFYDKIIKQAPEHLNEGGYLLFELGIGQADLVKSKMLEYGFENIQTEKDLAGIKRIIWGKK